MSEIPNYAKYNMGMVWTEFCCKAEEVNEKTLNDIIDKIHETNNEIRIITDLMNKLTHAKKDNKGADFSEDEKAMEWIEHIYARNPTIFESRTATTNGKFTIGNTVSNREARHIYKSTDDIEPVIKGLDAELKILSADLNENLMKIQSKTDSNSKVSESARRGLEEATQHIKSIQNATRGR